MSFALLKTVDVIEIMENYVSRIRPPEHIREKLDITYSIDNQSVTLQEVRPLFNDPEIKKEYGYAKATFIKTSNKWKVYWMRSNLKWTLYAPQPIVNTLTEFVNLVEEDRHHCFKG